MEIIGKGLARIIRWLWLLVALVVVTVAVVVSIGRQLAPFAAQYQENIQDYIAENYAIELEFDSFSLSWQNITPVLELNNISIPAQRLGMRKLLVDLDPWRSLWYWRPIWYHLEVDSPVIRLDLSKLLDQDSKAGSDFSTLWDILLLSSKVEVNDSLFELVNKAGVAHRVTVPEIYLENTGNFHRLESQLLQDGGGRAEVLLELQGDHRTPEEARLRGYVSIQDFSLAPLAPLLDDDVDLNPSRLNLSLSINSEEAGRLGASGHLLLNNGPALDGFPQVESLSSDIVVTLGKGEGWLVSFQELDASLKESPVQDLPFSVVQVRKLAGQKTVELGLGRLDLAKGAYLAGPLLPEKLQALIDQLSPKGQLENLWLTGSEDDNKRFVLRGNLHNVSVQAWSAAPAVRGINGYLEVDASGGKVLLDVPDSLGLAFPRLFDEGGSYAKVQGDVRWHIDKTENRFWVYSGPVHLESEVGVVNGQFLLAQPLDKTRELAQQVRSDREFFLHLGAANAKARYASRYLPKILRKELREWISASIAAGTVEEGVVAIRNRVDPSSPVEHSVQMGFDVAEAGFNYHQQWPGLSKASAEVLIEEGHVSGTVESGTVMNSRVESASFSTLGEGKNHYLKVNGIIKGPAADAVGLLRTAPVGEKVNQLFSGWQAGGDFASRLNLQIPLAEGAPSRQRVRADFWNANLQLQDLNLSLSRLKGDLSFDSRRGLSSNKLRGRVLGQPFTAAISNSKDSFANIQFVTQGDTENIHRWSKLPVFGFASGKAEFQGQIDIPKDPAADDPGFVLTLASDLQGVTIDFPPPYGKPATEAASLQVSIPIYSQQQLYRVSYRDQVQVIARKPSGETGVDRIGIYLGKSEISLPPRRGLWLSGVVERFNIAEGPEILRRYDSYQLGDSGAERRGSAEPDFPFNLDGSIKRLEIGELAFEGVEVNARKNRGPWLFNFSHPDLQGELRLFEDQPFELKLGLLHLGRNASAGTEPSGAGSEPERSPLDDLDFSGLPRINVQLENVRVADEEYGSWAFELYPDKEQLTLKNLTARTHSIQLGKSGSPTELIWYKNATQNYSVFKGGIFTGDVADVFRSLDVTPLAESKRGQADIDIAWPGSPLAVDLNQVSGSVKVSLSDGIFLENNEAAQQPVLRLIGLFNFDSWARRLRLDFSDLFKRGLTYDRMGGQLDLKEGLITFNTPWVVKTPSGELSMEGRLNMNDETLNTHITATLPVGGNLAVITALAGGLPAAAGVYVVSKIFNKQVAKVASVRYRVQGSWDQPEVSYETLKEQKQGLAEQKAEKKTAPQSDAAEQKPSPGN